MTKEYVIQQILLRSGVSRAGAEAIEPRVSLRLAKGEDIRTAVADSVIWGLDNGILTK